MRKICILAVSLASVTLLFSCSSSRKASRDFVPFSTDIKQRLEKDNIDLKQVQFYVDQKLILSRNLGDQKAEVSSGVVKLENGKYINEVIIPSFTPGVCDTILNDKMMISFEKGNNDIAFGQGSGNSFAQYVLYGTEWRNGTAAVTFDSNKFRARCGTCTDVAMATLLVKKKEIDKYEHKTRVLKGRKIDE